MVFGFHVFKIHCVDFFRILVLRQNDISRFSPFNRSTCIHVLFPFFYVSDDSKELLPLCRKYQVTWLFEKIANHLFVRCIRDSNFHLECLQLTEEYEMKKLRRRVLVLPVDSFVFLQSSEEFNQLNNENKYILALNRLKQIIVKARQGSVSEHFG